MATATIRPVASEADMGALQLQLAYATRDDKATYTASIQRARLSSSSLQKTRLDGHTAFRYHHTVLLCFQVTPRPVCRYPFHYWVNKVFEFVRKR